MRKQTVSFLLILVLIPLVNLGPSLHRLSCFGLHGDSCCDSFEHIEAHSCCDQHHSCSDTENRQRAPGLSSDHSHSDCLLCRFFSHFNAIDATDQHVNLELRFCDVVLYASAMCDFEVVPDQSRGPPVLSLVAFC